MTRAQRKAIDRLKKKHRCAIVVLEDHFIDGFDIKVQIVTDELPEDERVKVIRPSGLVEEPADLGGAR